MKGGREKLLGRFWGDSVAKGGGGGDAVNLGIFYCGGVANFNYF